MESCQCAALEARKEAEHDVVRPLSTQEKYQFRAIIAKLALKPDRQHD